MYTPSQKASFHDLWRIKNLRDAAMGAEESLPEGHPVVELLRKALELSVTDHEGNADPRDLKLFRWNK